MEAHLEALLEGTVLAVAAVLAGRVLLKRPVRRELRAHPRLSVVLAVAAALALALFFRVWFYSDIGRRLLVALVAAGALIAFWRARPHHGRSRGLPPGSLGVATSLDSIDDQGFYARAAERWGPIFKMSQFHQSVVCITDLPMGMRVLREQGDALVQSDWSFNRLVPGGYIEYMNGDVHRRYRDSLSTAFTVKVLAANQPAIIAVVRQQLAELAQSDGGECVDPEPFLLPISLTSLIATVLGVSSGSVRFDTMNALFIELNRPMELFLPTPRSRQDVYRELAAIVSDLASSARAESSATSDVSSILNNLVAENPRVADDETMVGNLILMVKEGSIMVRGLLRWLIVRLAEDASRAHQLREAGTDQARLGILATSFVHETIRLHESRYIYRVAARDVVIGSYHIPKGWLVRLCIGEAHEHADRFPAPMQFDANRFVDGLPDRGAFCPFGDGEHACLGADVALAIATTFVREAALGYDIRSVQHGAAWRINRHWGLWRPSQSFRVAISTNLPSTDPALK